MRLETSRLTIDHLRFGDLLDLHRMDTDLSVRRYIDGKASSLEKRINISPKILSVTVRMDMAAMRYEISTQKNFLESAAF